MKINKNLDLDGNHDEDDRYSEDSNEEMFFPSTDNFNKTQGAGTNGQENRG